MTATSGWRSFVSWVTLVSALLAVALWSLQWNWLAGVLVVVLLYAHEAGHVLAAFWRRVPVQRAPVFLPGLGAVVVTSPGPHLWDRVWVSEGGPLVGAVCALLAKQAGLALHLPTLAFAGDFMLLLNLINLAPFSPLDGGQIVVPTGWLGLIPAAALGGFVLAQGSSFFWMLMIFLGIMQGVRATLSAPPVAWSVRLRIFGLYLASLAAIGMAYWLTPRVPWLPSARPEWLPSLGSLFDVYIGALVISSIALRGAFHMGASARGRYVTALLLGWPQYALQQGPLVAIMACLASESAGLPGLEWLRRLLHRYAAGRSTYAGAACAYGFDCLMRQGRETEAAAWLEECLPLLREAGSDTIAEAHTRLVSLHYNDTASNLVWTALAGQELAPPANAAAAHSLAVVLGQRNQEAAALPLAQAAVAAEPENPAYLDTLGRVLLYSGDPGAAEGLLRHSLQLREYAGAHIALARDLAALQRYPEAVQEADRVLASDGAWPAGEPSREMVQGWVTDWMTKATEAGTAILPPAPPLRSSRSPWLGLVALGLAAVVGLVAGASFAGGGFSPAAGKLYPQSVENSAAQFYGDKDISSEQLMAYASLLKDKIADSVRNDTGLRPGDQRPVIIVHGDEAGWTQVGGTRKGLYLYNTRRHEFHVAAGHFDGRLRGLVLTAVYTQWLLRKGVDTGLPSWFMSGLEFNEAAQLAEGTPDWRTKTLNAVLQEVAGRPTSQPVPRLNGSSVDELTGVAAVGQLLASRGREPLQRFCQLTDGGRPFSSAFREAFNISLADYQKEFEQALAAARGRNLSQGT